MQIHGVEQQMCFLWTHFKKQSEVTFETSNNHELTCLSFNQSEATKSKSPSKLQRQLRFVQLLVEVGYWAQEFDLWESMWMSLIALC